MKRLVAITALVLSFPLIASADLTPDCGSASIEWIQGSPILHNRAEADELRFDAVGRFVNFQWANDPLGSYEIPADAVSFVICPNGITFELGTSQVPQITPRDVPVPAPVIDTPFFPVNVRAI